MLQNFCFISLQFIRIGHCSKIAEVITEKETKIKSVEKEEEVKTALIMASKARVELQGFGGISTTEKHNDILADPENIEDRYALTDIRKATENAEIYAEICRFSNSRRSVPVEGYRLKMILSQIKFSLRAARFRYGLSCLLDFTLRINFWKRLPLVFPVIIFWSCQVAITVCLFHFHKETVMKFPIQIFDLRAMLQMLWTWNTIPLDIRVCFIIIGAQTLGQFLLGFLLVPFIDVFAVTLLSGLKIFSFFLIVLTFRDFIVFDDLFKMKTYGLFPQVDEYATLIFCVTPFFRLLNILYIAICCILGRSYFAYEMLGHPHYFANQKKGLAPQRNLFTGFFEAYDRSEIPRGDEISVISIASLTIYNNARYMLAPLSLHELLIGPNQIKAMRLNGSLLYLHAREIIIACVLEVWCLALYYGFPNSIAYNTSMIKKNDVLAAMLYTHDVWYKNFSIAQIFFASHFVASVAYMIFSQTVRILVMQRFFQKALYKDIFVALSDRKEGSAESAVQQLDEIAEKYRYEHFMRPTEIFPPFLFCS
ncbi:hypothetical protein IE077_001340 [Cardiosporidium cionae]|uniref:Uncharacterized protein n=1 Tax=Cardiosporidium cionae TaxID=476202 RepID=A0ABQ7J5G3_9APIC|nr:hypothetical protein IE077_001340 [Cardiosporidium cionae]|eukprot:KAF8819244.1 hypothetical protein IE077_001340 [Cardiosporidium cionae]